MRFLLNILMIIVVSPIIYGIDAYRELVETKIINSGDYPHLHLGCGSNHLLGYVNIDFPLDNHTIQTISGADYFADITKLQFPNQSVASIRSHHVFEHFDRSQALAMLCAWQLWLKDGGGLIIETPDFERAIRRLIKTPDYLTRQRILRHIFGSHEADWAIHCDGWYKERFVKTLTRLGFKIERIEQTNWSMIDNITVFAKKNHTVSLAELKEVAREILQESTIDISNTECKMLSVFYENWEKYLREMIF